MFGHVIADQWGVTAAEVRRPYPCDEWVKAPTLSAWRGVTVNASADDVWRWVVQVRLAPYSYDWIDNLVGPVVSRRPRDGSAATAQLETAR